MRALVQRVERASVAVGDDIVGTIGAGLCVLVGVTHTDGEKAARRLAERVWRLRIFSDEQGRTNRSAEDLGLPMLVVSQFTLYADTSRGRRPSFTGAAPPSQAVAVVDVLVESLQRLGASVACGRFGASMKLELVNDGPFTILLEEG